MILPVTLLFIIFAIASLSDDIYYQITRNTKIFLILSGIALILIATYRPSIMPDYVNYLHAFKKGETIRFEVAYDGLIRLYSKHELDFICLLYTSACLSVSLKIYAISKETSLIWTTMLLYLSHFFILHDMIQMRAAIASGLLLVSIRFLTSRQLIPFLIICGIAVCFHYSALIIIPLWFINKSKAYKKFYMYLIPVSYALALAGIFFTEFIKYIPLGSVNYLLNMYSGTINGTINIFNTIQIMRCIICIWFWFKLDYIQQLNENLLIILKIYTIALALMVLFSSLPVAAFRLSELLLIVEILLVPYLTYTVSFQHRTLGKFCIIGIAAIFLISNIYINKYLM